MNAPPKLPGPPPIPREEPVTPPPPPVRPSGEVEAVRAVIRESAAPKEAWATALEEEAKRLRQEMARNSQENLERDAEAAKAIIEHDERIKRIEASSSSAAASSGELVRLLSGFLPPKVVGGLLAAWAVLQTVVQLISLVKGGK